MVGIVNLRSSLVRLLPTDTSASYLHAEPEFLMIEANGIFEKTPQIRHGEWGDTLSGSFDSLSGASLIHARSGGQVLKFRLPKPQRRRTSMAKKLRYMSKIAAIFARTDNTRLSCTQPIANLPMARL